jgi:hypothetical protein
MGPKLRKTVTSITDAIRNVRRFNRFELKYMITLQQAERLRRVLRTYVVPDEHGDSDGHYTVTSLYYDSPSLRCYWENEDGVKFRRKLRIRRYEAGAVLMEETLVFVEIKQRINRVTQKRRALLPYDDALRLCNDRQIPDYVPDDEAVIEEIYAFLWRYNLRPVSIVRYERQAFVGTDYDIGLRVTFDTFLSCQPHQHHLHEPASGLPMLPANLVVMEIKVNERIPYWLTDLIAAHNLQVMRFSKYCRSIEMGENMPSRRWRHLAAERSRYALPSSLSAFDSLTPFKEPSLSEGVWAERLSLAGEQD